MYGQSALLTMLPFPTPGGYKILSLANKAETKGELSFHFSGSSKCLGDSFKAHLSNGKCIHMTSIIWYHQNLPFFAATTGEVVSYHSSLRHSRSTTRHRHICNSSCRQRRRKYFHRCRTRHVVPAAAAAAVPVTATTRTVSTTTTTTATAVATATTFVEATASATVPSQSAADQPLARPKQRGVNKAARTLSQTRALSVMASRGKIMHALAEQHPPSQ